MNALVTKLSNKVLIKDKKTIIMISVTPLKKFLCFALIILPVLINFSCSSDDDSDADTEEGPKGNCIENGAEITITGNHNHTLEIPTQDIISGTTKVYPLIGATGHEHMLTITTENFATLKTNNAITIAASTNAGHTHAVTIGCKE
ncbi:MAG: hypothetical protein ABJD66_02425 [Cellulophaga sp.]|uniref:hypothetical protein n=1 Tax=Cellulophaga sp. TaxID=1972202 RepID=UPI003263554D